MAARGSRYGRRLLSSFLTVTLQTETGGANSRTAQGQAQGQSGVARWRDATSKGWVGRLVDGGGYGFSPSRGSVGRLVDGGRVRVLSKQRFGGEASGWREGTGSLQAEVRWGG
ncbi:Hypp4466 [Branchiostoma lanceolatum]|uniref:Hypp4466 protein n=1 Tax=Branchiostoma lanceolatum TaxID=7740 RepID=A0A8K0ABD5_BRALA|nr:Hypp4466 [Branchiostoma lanceolatum]